MRSCVWCAVFLVSVSIVLGDDSSVLQCTSPDSNTVVCNGTSYHQSEVEHFDEPSDWSFWIDIAVSIFLVICAGLFSGLTLGLLSIDLLNLEIIQHAGAPKDRERATRIMPLLKRHHLLLVTLLLSNAAAMEALPIFLDRMMHPVFAVLLSISVVLIFGEVIPQAVCSRYGLAIGATMAPFVQFMVWLLFVVAYPISKALDVLLGSSHRAHYRRAELAELVALHETGESANDHGDHGNKEWLTSDESRIIRAALAVRTKTVAAVMTPLERVFSVNVDAPLTVEALQSIHQSGFSRVPVWRETASNIIGFIALREFADPRSRNATKVGDLKIHRLASFSAQVPLYDSLNVFQNGGTRMALVLDKADLVTVIGIVTLHDISIELLQKEQDDSPPAEGAAAAQLTIAYADSSVQPDGTTAEGAETAAGVELEEVVPARRQGKQSLLAANAPRSDDVA